MSRIFRLRRSASVAQPELRAAIAALQLASIARGPSKRAKARAALESAKEGLRSAAGDRWHRELDSGSRNWSDARARELIDRINHELETA